MTWFMTVLRLDSMAELVARQVCLLYDIELRVVDLLPRIAQATHDARLRALCDEHWEKEKDQVARLETVFALLAIAPDRETSHGLRGLAHDTERTLMATGEPAVRDAALIAVLQNIVHYEVATYGCARAWSEAIGRHDVALLLQRTLDEESNLDRRLTAVAERSVNLHAAQV